MQLVPETLTNGDNPAAVQNEDQPEQPLSDDSKLGDEELIAGTQPSLTGAKLPAVPQAMMGTGIDRSCSVSGMRANYAAVQSEDMKNLMLSWYYAGYYTGLYEGKQQGYVSAKQGG